MEARVENRSNYPGVWSTFHFWEFKRQNGLILELLRQSGLNYAVLPARDQHASTDDHAGESAGKPGITIMPIVFIPVCLEDSVYNQILALFYASPFHIRRNDLVHLLLSAASSSTTVSFTTGSSTLTGSPSSLVRVIPPSARPLRREAARNFL
jgi:hypothetical protein